MHTDEAVLLTFDIRGLHLLRWILYIRSMFSCLAFGNMVKAQKEMKMPTFWNGQVGSLEGKFKNLGVIKYWKFW